MQATPLEHRLEKRIQGLRAVGAYVRTVSHDIEPKMGELHTGVAAEGRYSLVRLRIEVQLPGMVRGFISLGSSCGPHFVLPGYGLSVKDEEGRDLMRLPLVQVALEVGLDSSQATKRGEKRLVEGDVVEEELDVVSRVNGDGAALEFGQIVNTKARQSQQELVGASHALAAIAKLHSLLVDPRILHKSCSSQVFVSANSCQIQVAVSQALSLRLEVRQNPRVTNRANIDAERLHCCWKTAREED